MAFVLHATTRARQHPRRLISVSSTDYVCMYVHAPTTKYVIMYIFHKRSGDVSHDALATTHSPLQLRNRYGERLCLGVQEPLCRNVFFCISAS